MKCINTVTKDQHNAVKTAFLVIPKERGKKGEKSRIFVDILYHPQAERRNQNKYVCFNFLFYLQLLAQNVSNDIEVLYFDSTL